MAAGISTTKTHLHQDGLLALNRSPSRLLACQVHRKRVVAINAHSVDAVAWTAGGDAIAGVLLRDGSRNGEAVEKTGMSFCFPRRTVAASEETAYPLFWTPRDKERSCQRSCACAGRRNAGKTNPDDVDQRTSKHTCHCEGAKSP